MGIFRSRQIVEESLAERYNTASAMHGSAVSIFQDAASALSDAQAAFLAVADEANSEVARLQELRDNAYMDAAVARRTADSLLNLTKGYSHD